MKFVTFVAGTEPGRAPVPPLPDAVAAWLTTVGDVSACVVRITAPDQQGSSPFRGLIEMWADTLESSRSCSSFLAQQGHIPVGTWRVWESVEKDLPVTPPAGTGPEVTLVAAWTRRADLTAVESHRHWDEHVELAKRVHVGARRYSRNWVTDIIDGADGAPEYQGIALLTFANGQDLAERLYDEPASAALIAADTEDFIDVVDSIVTEEHVLRS